MKIFKEKAGVISEEPTWICFHNCYMYTHSTLFGLLITIITEWKQDKNMVG